MSYMKQIAYLFFFILSGVSCDSPEVIYSEVPIDYFLDKWWAIEDNSLIETGYCMLLSTADHMVWIHSPEDISGVGVAEGSWAIEGDHILLNDIYGTSLSIWVYGTCGDFEIIAVHPLVSEESKIYSCPF